MVRPSIPSRRISDEHATSVSSPISCLRRFKFYLPSPFVVAITLVFVALPLVWTENDAPPFPATQALFNLKADVTCLAVSADAERIAATCRDRPVWMWLRGQEADWGEALLPEHHPGGTRSLALSPDGSTLAAGNVDGTLCLWDTASGNNRVNLRAGSEMILAVAFSQDGSRVACSSTDSRIHVWDLPSHRLLSLLTGHQGSVTTLAFSPGGRLLASGGDDQTVRIWDVDQAREAAQLHEHRDVVLALAFSPDGELIASTSLGGAAVVLWDFQKRETRAICQSGIGTFTCMAFSRDGQSLITGDERGAARLWDLGTLQQKTMFPIHDGWVKGLSLARASETLVTGGNDGLVKVWNLPEVLKSVNQQSQAASTRP